MTPDNQTLTLNNTLLSPGTKKVELEYGKYSLLASYPKYIPFYTNLTVNIATPNSLTLDLEPKSRKVAIKKSILFPGLGQQYYENKTKALLFSAATLGAGALLSNSISSYQKEEPLVGQYQTAYRNANTQLDIESSWQTYQDQVSTVNDLQSQILIYGATLGATWLLNVLDAILFNGLLSD